MVFAGSLARQGLCFAFAAFVTPDQIIQSLSSLYLTNGILKGIISYIKILTYRNVRELSVYLTAIIGGHDTELMGGITENSVQVAKFSIYPLMYPCQSRLGVRIKLNR